MIMRLANPHLAPALALAEKLVSNVQAAHGMLDLSGDAGLFAAVAKQSVELVQELMHGDDWMREHEAPHIYLFREIKRRAMRFYTIAEKGADDPDKVHQAAGDIALGLAVLMRLADEG